MEKYKNKTICMAHFSDLLRVSLLSKYGGIWIDASVFLTKPTPQDIKNADFFIFKRPNAKPNSRNVGNWFIASKPNSPLINMIKDLLLLYWEDNDTAIDYFIMHYLFTVAVRENKIFKQEFAKIPLYSNRKPHLFDRLLHSKKGYSDKLLKKYYNDSFCQKLFHRHDNIKALLKRINDINLQK